MNPINANSRRTLVTLGALLFLAATASGCGVGLPTQPNLEQAAGDQRIATGAMSREISDPLETEDSVNPSGGGLAVQGPAGEIVIPTPTGNRTGNGLAKGHFKNKK